MFIIHNNTTILRFRIFQYSVSMGTTRAPGVAPHDLTMRRGSKVRDDVAKSQIKVVDELCTEVKGPNIPVPRDPGKSFKHIFLCSATHSGKHNTHRKYIPVG